MDNPQVIQGDHSLLTEEDKVRWFRSLTVEERLEILEQQMAWMRENHPELCKAKPPEWTDNWVIISLTDGIRYGPGHAKSDAGSDSA
jgi:hypothetical protein